MKRRTRDLEIVLRPVTPGLVRDRLAKSSRVTFLVSAQEKREMQETAAAFGLTLTDYMIRLHRLTVAIGSRRPTGRRRR
jgi:hypothetical protein